MSEYSDREMLGFIVNRVMTVVLNAVTGRDGAVGLDLVRVVTAIHFAKPSTRPCEQPE